MHSTKSKKPVWEDCTSYDANYMTFWKSKTMGTVRRSTVTTMWEEGWIGRTEDFRAVKILYEPQWWNTGHYTFVQTHRKSTSGMNPKTNYGLLVIMTYPRRFISFHRCVSLLGETMQVQGREFTRNLWTFLLILLWT